MMHQQGGKLQDGHKMPKKKAQWTFKISQRNAKKKIIKSRQRNGGKIQRAIMRRKKNLNAILNIMPPSPKVDAMSRAGDNRFFNPSLKFPVDKIWYYREDITDIIPEPLPSTSSARHFCVVPEIWAKHQYKAQ